MQRKITLGAFIIVLLLIGSLLWLGLQSYSDEGKPSADPGSLDVSGGTDAVSLAALEELQVQIDRQNRFQNFPDAPPDPEFVGTYQRRPVELRYWCSDACPDNGIYFLTYRGVNAANCREVSGHRVYKWGWGYQYLGCSPVPNEYSD